MRDLAEEKRITALHRKAMEMAHKADAAKDRRKMLLQREAFKAERDAADAVFRYSREEPTTSILCKSAGYLALDCGEEVEAARLAVAGLIGSPDGHTRHQLCDVLAKALST